MNITIAGHVDHGKSTLIGRLLYDTNKINPDKLEEIKKASETLSNKLEFSYFLDSLEEEREQNITIDTTQIFFKTNNHEYTIIDNPGHKEFIRNMITGTSLAEAAILIVKAEDGMQEQTKRHAYILSMLGINTLILTINTFNIDEFTKEKFDNLKKNILEFLNNIKLNPLYIIPISALEGDNIAFDSKKLIWYKGPNLLTALDSLEGKKESRDQKLIFPVQDVYKIEGKRIIVGRIESGKISIGDEVIFLPTKKISSINSIEIFEKQKTEAEAGESIGVTIKDPHFVERGQIVCKKEDLPKISNSIKARIFWMDADNLVSNEKLTLRCSTQEVDCIVEKINKKINSSSMEILGENAEVLGETEVGEVTIKTDTPVVFEKFKDLEGLGRFVLIRDKDIVAGGIIC